ncbi:MAG: bacteriophage abortive infection AbiH family protein [Bacteroidia bacterium]|nr:bacteriophage abortive infection AbiH family protein [Bacteroidia bacterium]
MTLYIIGNGFDRYHGLVTSYQAFAFFLQDNYSDIYDNIIKYYGLKDIDRDEDEDHWDPEWAVFEKAMADLNSEEILDEFTDYLANPANDDFSDGDWDTYRIEIQGVVDNLTINLFKAFKEFILQVEFPDDTENTKLHLEIKSLYLTFNYTDTLEKYYGISKDRILYIHKSAHAKDETLILGHGVDPQSFIPEEPKPPEGLNEEDLMNWQEQQADNFELSFEMGKDELLTYFSKSFKHTDNIINENIGFFKKINHIENIIVLGHSLSDVDMPYIKKVYESIQKNATWAVSYHRDEDKEVFKETLVNLGVRPEDIRLVKLNELKVNKRSFLLFLKIKNWLLNKLYFKIKNYI